jgi:hypothetical protein
VPALACNACGQGTINYVLPDTPISFGPVPGFEYRLVDFNSDGKADFAFDSILGISTKVVPQQQHRILVQPEPPPDLGGYVQPLLKGTSISIDLAQPGLLWNDGSGPVGGATLSACAAPFGCIGPWIGLTAYSGIEIELNGQKHYGWMQIAHFQFSNGGALVDWAYETRPGVPILAGAVPEPSARTLLLSGVVYFLCAHGRKRKLKADMIL